MRSIDTRGRRLDEPNLEARLARMPKAEMHFHFEGALRWSTTRELHPRGKELPEREPWFAQARPFAERAFGTLVSNPSCALKSTAPWPSRTSTCSRRLSPAASFPLNVDRGYRASHHQIS